MTVAPGVAGSRVASAIAHPLHRVLYVEMAAVFIVALAVFLALRTSDYLAVDGGLRALEVYRTDGVFLHSNNHLLYPVNVYWWSTLLRWLGFVAKGPDAFLMFTQAMNAAAGAGVLALLYGGTRALTSRVGLACLVTIGYGLSRAFLAHATSAAEPMLGLFWSAGGVALVVASLAHHRPWLLTAGGFALALALATYQSMVLITPAVLVLIWMWPPAGPGRGELRARVARAVALGSGAVAGVVTVYGIAYYWSGTRTVPDMITRFFHLESSHAYGGVTPLKIASVLPGLAYAMFPCLPRDCGGFRCLIELHSVGWWLVAVLGVLIAAMSIAAVGLLAARSAWSVDALSRVALVSCGAGLLSTGAALVYWLPTYDKLWLQPLACCFLAFGVVMKSALAPSRQATGGVRRVARCLPLVIVLIAAWNVPVTAASHWRSTPYLAEAREVTRLVGPRDLLVGDWNEVFLLYQALWGTRETTFNIPTETQRTGAAVIRRLAEQVQRTATLGGEVFFLGVLDLPRDQWGLAPALRSLPPYEALDQYRCCAETVKSFAYRGTSITLRRLSDRNSPPPAQ